MLTAQQKQWLALKNAPYLGGAFYGEHDGPVRADKFYDLVKIFERALSPRWKTNSLYLYPWEMRESYRASAAINWMKRGNSWDNMFQRIGKRDCRTISLACVPSSKTKAFEFSSISASTSDSVWPIFYLDYFGVYDAKEPLFAMNFSEVFVSLFRKLNASYKIKYGFIQLYTENCGMSIIPHRKNFPMASKVELVPLIKQVAKSRYDGQLSKHPPSKWDGEPFNLYWGNVIDNDVAKKSGLAKFLSKCKGLTEVEIQDTIPKQACRGRLGDDHLFFCLSGDIKECLKPDARYRKLYSEILKYMLERGAIYPGLG